MSESYRQTRNYENLNRCIALGTEAAKKGLASYKDINIAG